MIGNIKRVLRLIAGGERAGKSHLTEWLAKHYAKHRGPYLVYNFGTDDFEHCEFFEILHPIDVAENYFPGKENRDRYKRFMRKGQVTHFRFRGRVYHLKDFNKIMADRGEGAAQLKMFAIPNGRLREKFFESVLLYMSGCLLILDDARPLTKRGVPEMLATLLLRKNHGGIASSWRREEPNMKGVDVIMIYHNLSRISNEVFDYCNEIQIFRSPQLPGDNIENSEVKDLVSQGWHYLNTAPDYTSLMVYVKGPKRMTAEIVPANITKHLQK